MKYDWILFDADDTLFHFDAFKGMQRMFSHKGVDFGEAEYARYQEVNKPLWVEYQNGTITAAELKQRRFEGWAQQLGTTTDELNRAFLSAMAEICTLLPGAQALIEGLYGKAKLGIITNGFKELQAIRLQRTGMDSYFEHVIISEQVGVAKPDAGIFSYALEKMGYPDKSKVLMVGDNPYSDILGGLNFGFDTCWLNENQHRPIAEITPNYTVSSLTELKILLLA
ncbi:pyrimidine 5'-nucleotidase [Vibrio ostreicida]|uniref:Pyrimidine 5'-nucleotidase n=1 Tax=Vibrio ostreicida TaxID=526588 RepID=A0ABT8BYI1_9VIBR|nr:pyrimidine 5'-nucleotidase [Vibrio ostreicida]MDN3611459.1 pyrimidine 5'-nucleotidase [Vibrio ostreicida]NPD08960.1 pyrimidine 5'-nucleotidase [Vibrio ostreicida]